MIEARLSWNLSEATAAFNGLLSGVPVGGTAASVAAEIFFHFDGESKTDLKSLGGVVMGKTLQVPIDLEGRDIRLYAIARTGTGHKSARRVEDATQKFFAAPTVASIESAAEASGPARVTLTIAPNGGSGTVRVLRSIAGGEFAEIGTAAYNATSYVDTAIIVNGAYQYKLTQDGQSGESNTLSITVTVGSAAAGSPPDGLIGAFDDVDTVDLEWSNNGGTGDNIIERKINFGDWAEIGAVADTTDTYADAGIPRLYINSWYYYRVRNESVAGYSEELAIYIPALDQPL